MTPHRRGNRPRRSVDVFGMTSVKSFDLTGLNALVTGASSGLGLHFARLLARQGARVTLAARRLDLLEEASAAIEAEGCSAAIAHLDVVDEASIDALFSGG